VLFNSYLAKNPLLIVTPLYGDKVERGSGLLDEMDNPDGNVL